MKRNILIFGLLFLMLPLVSASSAPPELECEGFCITHLGASYDPVLQGYNIHWDTNLPSNSIVKFSYNNWATYYSWGINECVYDHNVLVSLLPESTVKYQAYSYEPCNLTDFNESLYWYNEARSGVKTIYT